MRPLIGKPNRQRKTGTYQQPALNEFKFLPKSHKASGGDFCNARKARQMFKNLTELRQNSDRRQSAINTIEIERPLLMEKNRRLGDIANQSNGFRAEDVDFSFPGDNLRFSEEEDTVAVEEAMANGEGRLDSSEIYRKITKQIQKQQKESHRVPTDQPMQTRGTAIVEPERNVWLQSMIDFAEQHVMLVELLLCLPMVLMALYILIVEQGSLCKFSNSEN